MGFGGGLKAPARSDMIDKLLLGSVGSDAGGFEASDSLCNDGKPAKIRP